MHNRPVMRHLSTLFAMGLTALLALPVQAQSPALQAKAGTDLAAISGRMSEQGGSARVILHLNAPFSPAAVGASPQAMADTAAALAPIRQGVAARLNAADPAIAQRMQLRQYTYLPFMAVTVNSAELEQLAADPAVARIDEDRIDRLFLDESVPLIGMNAAPANTARGAGTVVAVVDTGVAPHSTFLAGKIVEEACFSTPGTFSNATITSLCPNGAASQTGPNAANPTSRCFIGGCDHGTHVAGIAVGNRGGGSNPARGVAPDANLFAVQVFSLFTYTGTGTNPCGSGSSCVLSQSSDQIAGLDRIIARRTALAQTLVSVNMSLGGGGPFTTACDSDARKPAIDTLRAANVATVIASGNNSYTNGVAQPACISSAITVGNTTKSDNYWRSTNQGALVDLLAPGTSILSSIFSNGFGFKTGTSMAAPTVAGAWAAIRSAVPAATVTQVENALEVTGVALTDSGLREGGSVTGQGIVKPRIRVDLAIANLGGGGGGAPPNDNFANATTISGSSGSTSGNNNNATIEAGEPAHWVSSAGSRSIWWQWTAPSTGQATFNTDGSTIDTLLSIYTGTAVNALTQIRSDDDSGAGTQSRLGFHAVAGTTYRIAIARFGTGIGGPVNLNWSLNTNQGPAGLVAAVLPYARSVQVGSTVTAFATIINATGSTATNCYIQMPHNQAVRGTFQFQTASSTNTLTGTPNIPVNIANGAAQQFVFAFQPSSSFGATDIRLVFDCETTQPVTTFNGLNTFLLSASSTPVPDMVAIGATATGDGILHIPGPSSTGAFAASAINIGASGTIVATADTGGVSLPLSLSICQTNPSTGLCLSPPASSTSTSVATNQVVTYAVFATASGAIPLDPATRRIFLRLASGGVTRGATSVAVRTVGASPPSGGQQAAITGAPAGN